MAIDNVNRAIRPNPVGSDGRRRQQPEPKTAKQKTPQRPSDKPQHGGIDELV